MREALPRSSARMTAQTAAPPPGSRLRLVIVLTLLLMLVPLSAPSADAQSAHQPGIPIDAFGLMEPFADLLSGSSWLAATGLDPRLASLATKRTPQNTMSAQWSAQAAVGPGPGLPGGMAAAQPLVPFRNPGPAFSRNLLITRQIGLFPLQTEPHIAVNPNDPNHLVLGTIDYNFPTISSYVSFDGGETWDGPQQIRYFQEDFGAGGDPVVNFDREGNVYITQISIGVEEFVLGSLVSDAVVSTLIVAKSTDGGLTWSDAVPAARGSVVTEGVVDPEGRTRGEIEISFLDKQWIGTGPNVNDPETDATYMTYTDFTTTYRIIYADEVPFLSYVQLTTRIELVKSEDGGRTWSEPFAVSAPALVREAGASIGAQQLQTGENPDQEPGTGQSPDPDQQQQQVALPVESQRFVQGAQPEVMSDGTVVVSWYDSTNDGVAQGLQAIQVATSSDGGETFTDPKIAGLFEDVPYNPRTAFFRNRGLPDLAVGPDQEIYVVAIGTPSNKPTDDADVYFMRSLDKGGTWDEPLRLNGDETNHHQFFPAIDTAPNGSIHVMWGDFRDDPDEVRYHIYYTRSDDRGETFGFELPDQDFSVADTRVTDFPSNALRGFPNGLFLGDYFAIAATDEDVYLTWADTRLGEFAGFNQQIGFARQRPIASPSIFLNPPSGSAGRQVTIQGFNFQPESDIVITVGGTLVANQRTDDEGQFEASIFMPVTGEGATDISAYDASGNVATASFFTEFGFDSIQREIESLQAQIGAAPAPGTTPAPDPVGIPLPTIPPMGSAPPPAMPTPTPPDTATIGQGTTVPAPSDTLPPPPLSMTPTPTPMAASDDSGAVVTSMSGIVPAATSGLATFIIGMLATGGLAWLWSRRR